MAKLKKPKTLASLWVEAGGDPGVADIAAAIAMAESNGRVDAWNPRGRDKSAGLWQINYHGDLYKPRVRQFGTPEQLRRDPLANARAAVAIYKSAGNSFSPWTTYTGGLYKKHLGKASGYQVSAPTARAAQPQRGGRSNQPRQDPMFSTLMDIAFSDDPEFANLLGLINAMKPPVANPKVSKGGSVEPVEPQGDYAGVVAAAQTQLGKPYMFGSGPSTASFDCSDLVQWAYRQMGINIPRTTGEMQKALPRKAWKDIQPGDLVMKTTPGGTNEGGHVVMYIGNGKVIAAPYTGTVVQIQSLSRFRGGNYHIRYVPRGGSR